ncbi:MAG: hypothetical protein Phog2KO_11060 [Phototrophicaceae bacterium]
MVLFLSACSGADTIDLPNEIDSNAFSLNYPDDWQHQIPQTNMLFLASPEILAQEAGATVTLQRSVALSSSSESLSEALNTYLERGPLRADRAWDLVGELETLEIDSYETVLATVEGSEQADTLPMRSEIYVLQADSGFYFIFTLTAPIDQWETVSPTFSAIKDSIDIRE